MDRHEWEVDPRPLVDGVVPRREYLHPERVILVNGLCFHHLPGNFFVDRPGVPPFKVETVESFDYGDPRAVCVKCKEAESDRQAQERLLRRQQDGQEPGRPLQDS